MSMNNDAVHIVILTFMILSYLMGFLSAAKTTSPIVIRFGVLFIMAFLVASIFDILLVIKLIISSL